MHDSLGDQILAALDLLQQGIRVLQEETCIVVVQVAAPVIRFKPVQYADGAAFRILHLRKFRQHIDMLSMAFGVIHGFPAGQEIRLLLVKRDTE